MRLKTKDIVGACIYFTILNPIRLAFTLVFKEPLTLNSLPLNHLTFPLLCQSLLMDLLPFFNIPSHPLPIRD